MLQVQPVLIASMTKLLCKPPAPDLASTRQALASIQAPRDKEGEAVVPSEQLWHPQVFFEIHFLSTAHPNQALSSVAVMFGAALLNLLLLLGTPHKRSPAPEKAPKKARKKGASSDMAAEPPADKDLAKKQAAHGYASALPDCCLLRIPHPAKHQHTDSQAFPYGRGC